MHPRSKPIHPDYLLLTELSLKELYLECLDQLIYNDLPQYLLRISDMRLYHRSEFRKIFRPLVDAVVPGRLKTLMGAGRTRLGEQLRKDAKASIKRLIKYAIFSHRWGEEELQFMDVSSKRFGTKSFPDGPGTDKLLQFCAKAKIDYACEFVWLDSCCINKQSSAELEEAIRSMYKWYRDAYVCIVHLANSSSVHDFRNEPWFTRAWTLQELLAPRRIRMYGKDWKPICPEGVDDYGTFPWEKNTFSLHNDKRIPLMTMAISSVTGISIASLQGLRSNDVVPISEKMMWASNRRSTRTEDIAYSLLGIFDVVMPIMYGEGARAFQRLLEAIAQRSEDPSFLAYSGPCSRYSEALPISPACYTTEVPFYKCLGNVEFYIGKAGVHAKLVVIPVTAIQLPDGYYTIQPRDKRLARCMTITTERLRRIRPAPDPNLSLFLGIVNSDYSGHFEPGESYFGIIMHDNVSTVRYASAGQSTRYFFKVKDEGSLPSIEFSVDYNVPRTDVCLLHTPAIGIMTDRSSCRGSWRESLATLRGVFSTK